MTYILTVYDLKTQQARVMSRTELDLPKEAALQALAAVREGLPPHCGATLADKRGYNVRP